MIMVKKIVEKISILVLVVAMMLLISGCNNNLVDQTYVYDDTNYGTGNKAFNTDITEVNIDWILGNVFIQKSENDQLIVREDVSINLDDGYKMHHLLTDSSLDIKFAKSFENLKYKFGIKNLYVYLPKQIDKINITCNSADIEIKDVKIDNLNIITTSGSVVFDYVDIENLSIISDSGLISLFNNNIKQNNIITNSAKVGLSYTTLPTTLNVETKSGGITLYATKEDSFSVKKATVKGSFKSNLTFVENNNIYTFNSGSVIYQLTTDSGYIKVLEK